MDKRKQVEEILRKLEETKRLKLKTEELEQKRIVNQQRQSPEVKQTKVSFLAESALLVHWIEPPKNEAAVWRDLSSAAKQAMQSDARIANAGIAFELLQVAGIRRAKDNVLQLPVERWRDVEARWALMAVRNGAASNVGDWRRPEADLLTEVVQKMTWVVSSDLLTMDELVHVIALLWPVTIDRTLSLASQRVEELTLPSLFAHASPLMLVAQQVCLAAFVKLDVVLSRVVKRADEETQVIDLLIRFIVAKCFEGQRGVGSKPETDEQKAAAQQAAKRGKDLLSCLPLSKLGQRARVAFGFYFLGEFCGAECSSLVTATNLFYRLFTADRNPVLHSSHLILTTIPRAMKRQQIRLKKQKRTTVSLLAVAINQIVRLSCPKRTSPN